VSFANFLNNYSQISKKKSQPHALSPPSPLYSVVLGRVHRGQQSCRDTKERAGKEKDEAAAAAAELAE